MKVATVCQNCSQEFMVYEAWVRKGAGKNCSRKCAYESRTGRPSYERTEEHKQKMSKKIRSMDLSRQSKMFTEYNLSRKGKTFEEIYGDRAEEVRTKYGKSGELNPNWKGGKHRQSYPYIFYKLRPQVMERDNYICLNCDMTDEEARAKDSLGRGLTVHHIDYDKENNDLSNLATTCKWCNSMANGRREEWQAHYSALLG